MVGWLGSERSWWSIAKNAPERNYWKVLRKLSYEALDFHRQEILDLVGDDYEELVITV